MEGGGEDEPGGHGGSDEVPALGVQDDGLHEEFVFRHGPLSWGEIAR